MRILICCAILIFSGLVNGQTFEPPLIIDPPNPQVGDMVRVGIFEMFFPPCLDIPQENSIGETHSLMVDQGNIELNVLAITDPQCNPIPFNPAPREYYELGVLDAGEYILDVNYIQVSGFQTADIPPFPLPDFFFSASFGSPVSFNVRGAPQVVSALSWLGLFILVSLFIFSLFVFRRS